MCDAVAIARFPGIKDRRPNASGAGEASWRTPLVAPERGLGKHWEPLPVLLRRLRSQFLECTQEGYDIFPAQHADYMVTPSDGQLVNTIAVHLLEGGP